MIHLPSLRLAGLYLTIIMVISFFFSATIYELSIDELDRGFRRQADLIDKYPEFSLPEKLQEQIFNIRDTQYSNAKARVFERLLLINLVILGTGGILSYYLARRTIRPIEEAREAQSRFTADASHELRTPLAVMQSEIEVSLMDPKLNIKSAKEQLNSNLEEIDKLKDLSEKLLKLARLEDSELNEKKLSVKKIINTGISNTNALAKNKHIKIVITNKPSSNIIGDETRIIEAVSILLANAIKYSPEKTKIEISTKVDKRNVKISVKDYGVGIKPKELTKIFDRFYRADNSRTKSGPGGFGLGLAIAKDIVEQHDGSINVISSTGKGSTFTITLPRA